MHRIFLGRFAAGAKDAQDVKEDPLDRRSVWEASMSRISERPLLGFGIGAESFVSDRGSHNAYLSLLIEGGVLHLYDSKSGRDTVLNDEELAIHSPTFDPDGLASRL